MEANENTFHILSEDCFRLIFSHLTLQQQLSLRLVCTQWNIWIQSLFTSVRTLKVFGCEEDLEHIVAGMKNYRVRDTIEVQEILGTSLQRSVDDFTHDAFMVKKDALTAKKACTVLKQLFPNVQYLVLACKQLYSSDQLPGKYFGEFVFVGNKTNLTTFYRNIKELVTFTRVSSFPENATQFT